MYIGRIVAVGMTKAGESVGMYRVSSRSFPNREARLSGETVSIMPRPGFEDDLKKNPYITYNCIRMAGSWAVVSNGSHTDPIAEKIAMGMPVRDAFAMGLLAMDYEKDSLNTPRIVAAVNLTGNAAFLGIIRHDALLVRQMELIPGKAFYLATYEHSFPCEHFTDKEFDVKDAASACDYIVRGGVFGDFEKPVTAAAALSRSGKFELAVATI